jgi:hypothetical protein
MENISAWWCMAIILAMTESLNRRILVQDGLDKKCLSISKIIRAKMAAGRIQPVECLPSKLKALSSNPNTTKNKRKMTFFQHYHHTDSWAWIIIM